MRFLFALVLTLAFALPARAELQCFARYDGFWSNLAPTGAEMSATRCAPYLSLPSVNPPQAYRLQKGPVKSPQQITCQWTWTPGSNGAVFPENNAVPESIICNLFLAPF